GARVLRPRARRSCAAGILNLRAEVTRYLMGVIGARAVRFLALAEVDLGVRLIAGDLAIVGVVPERVVPGIPAVSRVVEAIVEWRPIKGPGARAAHSDDAPIGLGPTVDDLEPVVALLQRQLGGAVEHVLLDRLLAGERVAGERHPEAVGLDAGVGKTVAG